MYNMLTTISNAAGGTCRVSRRHITSSVLTRGKEREVGKDRRKEQGRQGGRRERRRERPVEWSRAVQVIRPHFYKSNKQTKKNKSFQMHLKTQLEVL